LILPSRDGIFPEQGAVPFYALRIRNKPWEEGMKNLKAFIEAVKASDLEAVTALLDASPELVQARPDDGASPLMTAAYQGADDVVTLLCERGLELDVFEATTLGDVARLSLLVIADANQVRAYSPDGWTPLHLACYFGQAQAAGLLLARGADRNAVSTNPTQNTPLHAAIAGAQDHEIIERLLAQGADVNAVDGDGVTPLHLAASRGDVALIDLLLARGAEVVKMKDGRTPEDLATERGHPEAAERLRLNAG
jgi:ankyrin repeat protein